jgi:hypothetical protein
MFIAQQRDNGDGLTKDELCHQYQHNFQKVLLLNIVKVYFDIKKTLKVFTIYFN